MMREGRRVAQKEKRHRQVADSLIEKWKAELDAVNEKANTAKSIKELNGLIPILLSLIGRSHDDEAEQLVRLQLTYVRNKIQVIVSNGSFPSQDSS